MRLNYSLYPKAALKTPDRRTCSASILCELQMSSFSLYIEMPDAHANPNAKEVRRVPSMLKERIVDWATFRCVLSRSPTTSYRVDRYGLTKHRERAGRCEAGSANRDREVF